MTKTERTLWWTIAFLFLAVFFLTLTVMAAVERSPGDWFQLVIELDTNDEFFDKVDRKFVDRMLNVLSAHEDAVPSPAQAKWLLDMKRRLDERRR